MCSAVLFLCIIWVHIGFVCAYFELMSLHMVISKWFQISTSWTQKNPEHTLAPICWEGLLATQPKLVPHFFYRSNLILTPHSRGQTGSKYDYRRSFYRNFVKENFISLKSIHRAVSDERSSLDKIMAWHQNYDSPLFKPMIGDTYMRQLGDVYSWNMPWTATYQ